MLCAINQMTSSGWREVLVDLDPAQSKSLRFVLSPSATPASSVYTAGYTGGEGAWLEVCPQGLVCVQEIAGRVVKHGGAALIADYGGTTGHTNTLRVSQGATGHQYLKGKSGTTGHTNTLRVRRGLQATPIP